MLGVLALFLIYLLPFSVFYILTKLVVSCSVVDEHDDDDGKGMHIVVVVLLSVLVSIILILGVVGAYKLWEKKIREQDQARLLKLFEDDDEIGDELGLGTVI